MGRSRPAYLRILTIVAIRDRDRKILWSRAGNCCSMCRAMLVREGAIGNGLTVIGDECHIVSSVPTGPRGGILVDDLDGYDNLILLCPNDHRLIDTLVDDYPRDRVLAIKRAHEDWVRTTLAASDGLSPLTILRAEPAALRYLGTAKELLNVAVSAEESSLDHEEIYSHVSAAQQREAVEVLQRALAESHSESHLGPDSGGQDGARTAETGQFDRESGSGGRTRTYDQAVNSRPLYRLSYAGAKVAARRPGGSTRGRCPAEG